MSEIKQTQEKEEHIIHGIVTYAESGAPAGGVRIRVMDADQRREKPLVEVTADKEGHFRISYDPAEYLERFGRAPDIYLEVYDQEGRLLTRTREALVRDVRGVQEIHVQLPGGGPKEEPRRIRVAGTAVRQDVFERLDAETVLKIAETVVRGRGDEELERLLEDLSPRLAPKRLKTQFSGTPLIRFLEETARLKDFSRDARLRLEEVLIYAYGPGAGYASYNTTNFSITYETSGSDAPPSGDTGGTVSAQGAPNVGTTTGGNGIPDYVEALGVWLENALATYTSSPFTLANPASGGRIPVTVAYTPYSGLAFRTGSMTVSNDLNDDLLAAVPTHELMHLIQYQYETAGTTGIWHPGMLEGGAVLGEDVVFDPHNRYIVQSTGAGILGSPTSSLHSWDYRMALFLKYLTEQQSSKVFGSDEPAIGVDAYRALLEKCDSLGYTTAALDQAIGELPWYQSFYTFAYLDAARLDETSAETLLGNFWLACYLKDFGDPVQIDGVTERRFDFMEDEENATWDSIFLGADTVSTLGAVTLTSTSTLNSGGSVTLSSGAGSVSTFAARFYKVNINSAVNTLRVDLTAGAGFTRPLVQIVLVEAGNVVRDILRSDRTTWSRTIANDRGGTDLDHIMIIVAGTDTGGTFSLSVQDVPAAPDVMVTRWHHRGGKHYEIDSFWYAWTWVSPDIWVDNDNNGLADNEVYFNQNNNLYIRLRNQGNAGAAGITVDFWYQDASGGLSDGAWLPVTNAAGVTQQLTGVGLAAQSEGTWSVDWAPAPSGTSHHFCVRAVVTVPGDPNTDNKRCLSNFGNVVTASPYLDLMLMRRAVFQEWESVEMQVIPRTEGKWFVSATDLHDLAQIKKPFPEPEIGVVDTIRVRKRAEFKPHTGQVLFEPKRAARGPCLGVVYETRRAIKPDPQGHYPTDYRALPPGLEGVPLITVAHVVNGVPIGGFTWALREEKE